MARTAGRPVPSGRVSARAAMIFGFVLGVLSVVDCSVWVNPLAAALSLCGFVGCTLVYTVWLKRRTPQNIVIGGAAGAVPPLVGWAAVTGGLDGMAVYLFAIVFFWTPPHFWALSLLMKDDYERVGVPMLPVVRGEAETRRQILLYAVLLYAVTQLPFCAGGLGAIYLVASLVLAACSSAAPGCCRAAPTGARPCACTCSRSSTSPCSSARWSPTSNSRPTDSPWTATSHARTSAPASSSPPSASSCSA